MPKNGKTEPVQESQPARGKPAVIPVPTRKDVFGDLAKVAKPKRSTRKGRPKK